MRPPSHAKLTEIRSLGDALAWNDWRSLDSAALRSADTLGERLHRAIFGSFRATEFFENVIESRRATFAAEPSLPKKNRAGRSLSARGFKVY
jgi:hypothetical protein